MESWLFYVVVFRGPTDSLLPFPFNFYVLERRKHGCMEIRDRYYEIEDKTLIINQIIGSQRSRIYFFSNLLTDW